MKESGLKMKFLFLFLFFAGYSIPVSSQEIDLGIFYGRFYAVYKSKDNGNGFRNLPGSQFNGYPAICFNKRFAKNITTEGTASFLAYAQYTATRLYTPGFYSVIYSGNVSFTLNYSVVNTQRFEARIKFGIGIGIIPDKYEGTFIEIFAGPPVDSISRGNIKRDFASLFPTFCTGLDFSYRLGKRFKASLGVNYQKGFFKITEYDIYYNDGSGNNDQHAKQWGNGSFYAIQTGIRYYLNNKKRDVKNRN